MKRFNSRLKGLGIMLALLLAFSAFSNLAIADETPPCNEGRAHGAAISNQDFHDCIQPFQGSSFWELTVEVVGTAGPGGCTYEVQAWICPECRPNQPCSRIACRQVAVAQIDSDFNVSSVTCNF